MKTGKARILESRGTAFLTVLLFTFVLTALVAGVLEWSDAERYTTTRYSRWLQARNAAEALCEYGCSQVYNRYSAFQSTPKNYFSPSGTNSPSYPSSTFWNGSYIDTSTASSDSTAMQLVIGPEVDITTPSKNGGLYYVSSGRTTLPNGSTNTTPDLLNTNDPNAPIGGAYDSCRNLQVIARATVKPPGDIGAPITAYVSETCSVRGAPVFGYAVFYANNDLEIQPGPTMNINGPVQVNGNLFVSQQGSGSLNFQNQVTVSGAIYHAWAGTSGGYSTEGTLGQTAVTFLSASGTAQITMDAGGSATTWRDSTWGHDYGVSGTANLAALVTSTSTTAFLAWSTTTYGNNVVTGAMGASTFNPVIFSEVIGVDTTTGTNITPNFHTLIDPPVLGGVSTASTNTYEAAQVDTEEQKLANQAGIYIKATVSYGTTVGSLPTLTYAIYGAAGSATALVSSPTSGQIGPNLSDPTNTATGGLALIPPANATGSLSITTGTGTQAGIPVPQATLISTPTSQVGTGSSSYWTQFWPTQSGTSGNALLTFSPFMEITNATYYLSTAGTHSIQGATYVYKTNVGSGTVVSTVSVGSLTGTVSSNTTPWVQYGMVDERRYTDFQSYDGPRGVDEVRVNMAAITAAVQDMVLGTSTASGTNNALTYSVGTTNAVWTGWNGGIYIDVETTGSTAVSAPTGTNYANGDVNGLANGFVYSGMQPASVYLMNGTVATGSSMIPQSGGVGGNTLGAAGLYEYPSSATNTAPPANPYGSGITIATNAPVYIFGDYNADGTATTGSDVQPDSAWSPTLGTGTLPRESPAYIAADAVTILTPDWKDSASASLTPTGTSSTGSAPTGSTYEEIAAALVTGITPTGTYYSGGLHNLPRFLQNLGSDTVTIRGAISCFFPSAIAKQPWYNSYSGISDYYGAPSRDWGYDTLFANGVEPPLVIQAIKFRRINFIDMSPSEFATTKAGMLSAFSSYQ